MGVTLLLVLALSRAPSVEGVGSVVSSVEVRLPPGADEKLLERVTTLVTVRRGQTLSRRSVQRSIENLWATGRFSDVVAQVEEVNGRVAVAFELEPRKVIGEVYFEGGNALGEVELRSAAKLEKGTEYTPERALAAADRVREALRRRGFQDARVEPRADEGEGGVSVGLVIAEGVPTLVAAVSVVGDPGLPLTRILDALGARPGDVLDGTRLDQGLEAVKRLFREERYYRARVEPPVLLPAGRVVLGVTAGPQFRLAFQGNHHAPERALRAVLAYDGEELLDSALAHRLAGRLSRFYRFHGFHDVEVDPVERTSPDGSQAVLTFEIDEGPPLRVSEVRFDGATQLPHGTLLGVLRSVMEENAPQLGPEGRAAIDPLMLEGRLAPPPVGETPSPPMETVLDEPTWLLAAKAMTSLYRSQGYLKALVRLDQVSVDRTTATARFLVDEGPRAELQEIHVTGLPSGVKVTALEEARLHEPFSPDTLERLRDSMLKALGRKGYLFAKITAGYDLDAAGSAARAALSVDPGPEVRVRAVVPVGNRRTLDELVLRQSTIVEGAPLDAEALLRTQSNLVGMGVFRTVDVRMLAPERPEPLKTVLLEVKERPVISGDFGVGYFLADGPRLTLDMDAPNVGGRAINVNGHAQINWFALSVPATSGLVDVSDLQAWELLGGRINLSAQSRSLLPSSFGLRLDLSGERVFRPQFRFTRLTFGPTMDWYRTFDVPWIAWTRPKLWLALQYQVEGSVVTTSPNVKEIELQPANLADQERLRFHLGTFLLQTVRLSPSLDLRDNALNPKKGLLLQASGEVTTGLYTRDQDGNPVTVSFFKASGLATAYVPVWKDLVLAVSARGGRVFQLRGDASTPPVNRFFLGGVTSMRGFNEDQLIPEDLRPQYRGELNDCRVLAVSDGCTAAATTLMNGKQVPSSGGETFVVFKSELRIPVLGSLALGAFFEAGNLWLSVPTSLALRTVAGGGLRYETPLGPLSLDVGVNLAPDTALNEPRYVIHFNIGVF